MWPNHQDSPCTYVSSSVGGSHTGVLSVQSTYSALTGALLDLHSTQMPSLAAPAVLVGCLHLLLVGSSHRSPPNNSSLRLLCDTSLPGSGVGSGGPSCSHAKRSQSEGGGEGSGVCKKCYVCEVCGGAFTRHNKKQHLQVHAPGREAHKLKCPVGCGRGPWSRHSDWAKHMSDRHPEIAQPDTWRAKRGARPRGNGRP